MMSVLENKIVIFVNERSFTTRNLLKWGFYELVKANVITNDEFHQLNYAIDDYTFYMISKEQLFFVLQRTLGDKGLINITEIRKNY